LLTYAVIFADSSLSFSFISRANLSLKKTASPFKVCKSESPKRITIRKSPLLAKFARAQQCGYSGSSVSSNLSENDTPNFTNKLKNSKNSKALALFKSAYEMSTGKTLTDLTVMIVQRFDNNPVLKSLSKVFAAYSNT
jgi:hypothetical protein